MNIMSVYYLYSYSYSYYYQNMFEPTSLVPTTMLSPTPIPTLIHTPTPTPKSGFIPTISPTPSCKFEDDFKSVNNITNNLTSPTLIPTKTTPIIHNNNTNNKTNIINTSYTNNNQTSLAIRTLPCLVVSLLWISLITFI